MIIKFSCIFLQFLRHHSANACVTPIVSVHGCHVQTIEDLSDRESNSCHVFQVKPEITTERQICYKFIVL